MADLSSKQLVELVQKSRLVSKQDLRTAIDEVKAANQGKVPRPAQSLAAQLIRHGHLTEWQFEKLKSGKHRGFFIGKYRLRSHLGSGGMSSVYLADHTVMNRQVAIKVLPKNRIADKSYLERFYLEAQAVARLDHPNIVRAFDVDHEGDTHYLVMEYVAGADLSRLVKLSERYLQFADAADFVAQAARGLQHAHDAGLIHRDVKPANLLVADDGTVKLLDLGLALFTAQEDGSLTEKHDEKVLGTADYLAPEQAISSHHVDSRADVYGLGCTLYFALVGQPPFAEGTLAQRIAAHQSVPPRSVREFRPDCPDELASICHRMIAKSPDDRYQKIGEVADHLERWRKSTKLAAPAPTEMPVIVTSHPDAPSGDASFADLHAPDLTNAMKLSVQSNTSGIKRRRRSAKKPPFLLWIFLFILTGIAVALAFVFFQR